MFGVVSKKAYESLRQEFDLVKENLNQKNLELIKSTSQLEKTQVNSRKLNAEVVNLKLKLDLAEKTLAAKDVSFHSQAQLDLLLAKIELDNAERYKEELTENLDSDLKSLNEHIEEAMHELEELKLQEAISSITNTDLVLSENTSADINVLICKNKELQKELIKQKQAFNIKESLLFNNSQTKGKARQSRLAVFLLKSFNSEVDNLISQGKTSNFHRTIRKINNWFHKVNKAGADNYIEISQKLLELRLEEYRYAFEYKLKREMEAEEQRYLNESIREENKVNKEIEAYISKTKKEEENYTNEIADAESKLKNASYEQILELNELIKSLSIKLEIASREKERAISMAQLTRSGYVYVISNKGAFGEDVYKIGMTRRLEPLERVKELGSASVPFPFDVHAIIPSDDAPSLENKLHKQFENYRLNKVNLRKEFFKVSIDKIEVALNDFTDKSFSLIK